MSIFSKLLTLFRGASYDAGAAVVDANALRILDQEIRDADSALGKARDDLAALVAKRRILEKEVHGLKRIKERQAIQEEKFRAAGELEDKRTGADLDAKLAAAGILPGHASASDILARLKAPQGEPMPQLEAPHLQIESQPVPVERDE